MSKGVITAHGGATYNLGLIMEFVLNSDKFRDWKTWEIKNAIGYAIEHEKYFTFYQAKEQPGMYWFLYLGIF